MPEYLAPGVYVEETSFRAKSIEGVGTSTTAFVGPTRRGPVSGTPELLTSFADFERIYGGLVNLELSDITNSARKLNYLAHAVRAYFDNGGSRLYVVRAANNATAASAVLRDGGADVEEGVIARARFPGKGGEGRIVFRETRRLATNRTLRTAPQGTLLRTMSGTTETLYVKDGAGWKTSSGTAHSFTGGETATPDSADSAEFLTLAVETSDADGYTLSYDEVGFDRTHPRWVGTVLAQNPASRAEALQNLVWLDIGDTVSGFELRAAIAALSPVVGDTEGRRALALTGGSDGAAPIAGSETQAGSYTAGFAELVKLEDVAIVAAPGHSVYPDFQAIQGALISHAERRRAYRIAVLDTPPAQLPSEAQAVRSRMDSKYAALYYPWVVVSNPLALPGRDDIPREIPLPASGFVCGIYARNDVERGVYKAPANEVVRGALRFESDINFAQQELLNPLGVNCLRFFAGRGNRLWGARLASSDPEWKYVNVRRYFNYLEASVDRGTQWAVFEPNGERLWANIRQTVSDFLYNEWRNGALLGASPEEAYFVRCDRTTMTQNDLDNGRLICLVGVAALKPAEFVIFRIGQKTADARS